MRTLGFDILLALCLGLSCSYTTFNDLGACGSFAALLDQLLDQQLENIVGQTFLTISQQVLAFFGNNIAAPPNFLTYRKTLPVRSLEVPWR